jgi:hypothetical protein
MRAEFCAMMVLVAVSTAVGADVFEVESGQTIKDGLFDLNVTNTAAPTAVDWNNDGKIDLLVGQFWSGSIRLYLNQSESSNSAPVFNGSSTVIASIDNWG